MVGSTEGVGGRNIEKQSCIGTSRTYHYGVTYDHLSTRHVSPDNIVFNIVSCNTGTVFECLDGSLALRNLLWGMYLWWIYGGRKVLSSL